MCIRTKGYLRGLVVEAIAILRTEGTEKRAREEIKNAVDLCHDEIEKLFSDRSKYLTDENNALRCLNEQLEDVVEKVLPSGLGKTASA